MTPARSAGAAAAPPGIGAPARRTEDARLVTGRGRYGDDVNLPGQAYASLVRSPHAHARIARIDGRGALATPGVIAVLTGADAAADGLQPIPHRPVPTNPHELPLRRPRRRAVLRRAAPAAAGRPRALRGRGRRHGDRRDAAGGARRRRGGARRLRAAPARGHRRRRDRARAPRWSGARRGSNVCVESRAGDAAATEAAFARGGARGAAGHPGEPRSPACRWSRGRRSAPTTRPPAASRSTRARAAWCAHPGRSRRGARRAAGARCAWSPGDVGGNFGTRNSFYPEFAAGRLGGAAPRPAGEVDVRPARGVPHRLPGPRPRVATPSWRSTPTARFLALRGVNTSNVGAHTVSFVPLDKGVACCRASTASPRRRCAAAPCSPTPAPPRPTGARAARRSCS